MNDSSFLLRLSPPSPTPLLLRRSYTPPTARIRPFPAGPSDRITFFVFICSRRLVLYFGAGVLVSRSSTGVLIYIRRDVSLFRYCSLCLECFPFLLLAHDVPRMR